MQYTKTEAERRAVQKALQQMWEEPDMRKMSSEMQNRGASPEEIAKAEIAFQYIVNSEFRSWLNDFVFTNTYRRKEGRR